MKAIHAFTYGKHGKHGKHGKYGKYGKYGSVVCDCLFISGECHVLFRAEALLRGLTAFPLNWRKTSTNIGLLLGHAVLLPYLSRN